MPTTCLRAPVDGAIAHRYGRYEVLSGFVNAVFLVFVAFFVIVEAVERINEPPDVMLAGSYAFPDILNLLRKLARFEAYLDAVVLLLCVFCPEISLARRSCLRSQSHSFRPLQYLGPHLESRDNRAVELNMRGSNGRRKCSSWAHCWPVLAGAVGGGCLPTVLNALQFNCLTHLTIRFHSPSRRTWLLSSASVG